ncbi:nucleoside deaminase [Kitasatospora sp. NPDC101155]|uniref:nucleoside deaminase n=1 Tax=Kitasatospora sp. NPDC101155 TaxID=3364097 RepID=UPI00382A93F3
MDFVQRTIDIARQNVAEGGRPFATVIVKDGAILAESPNKVAQTGDPTAHAEILAIREACTRLGTEHLTGTTIYVLAHPCPMCLGSLYYCSPDEVVFLTTRDFDAGGRGECLINGGSDDQGDARDDRDCCRDGVRGGVGGCGRAGRVG